MDCAAYRRAILAEPHADGAELRSHLASCHDCTQYTLRLRRFEDRLDRALRVDTQRMKDRTAAPPKTARPPTAAPAPTAPPAAALPEVTRPPRAAQPEAAAPPLRGPPEEATPSPRTGPPQPPDARRMRPARRRYRRWSAAAAVLLAAAVAAIVWLAAPGPSLAADVAGHMAEEPQAWTRTDIPVPQSKLEEVLRASHVRLTGDAGLVSYANSCVFRGHTVPHLVVQTDTGPVTVMVLADEPSRSAVHFKEQGYQGVIVPVPGHGSLAVLERGAATGMDAVEDVAARVRSALKWTP
jgi:hypothetical protein